MNVKISVIIVAYNNQETIKDCLNSIFKYLKEEVEVIVIDNNSEDKTLEILETYKEKIYLIKSETNLGFSKGNNKGVKKAKGKLILLLNPDVYLIDNSIKELTLFLETNSQVGIVAPKLKKSTGEIQKSVSRDPSLSGAIKEYIFGQKNAYSQYYPKIEEPVEVECVYGAAMLMEKETFEKVDGFDERYFLYFEDLDLCRKVRKLGLKVIYFPGSVLIHEVGRSVSSMQTRKLPFGIRILANFIPIKNTGTQYYAVNSGNIYHGFLKAFLIRLISYIHVKSKNLINK